MAAWRRFRLDWAKITLALAVIAIAVSVTSVARAEMTLSWTAPPSCPQQREVLDKIRGLAGSLLEQTEGLSVEGNIDQVNNRFSLTLLVRDDREVRKRVMTSDSCADLAGAAAVTVALLLGVDPSSMTPPDDGNGDAAKAAGGAGAAGGSGDKKSGEKPGDEKPADKKSGADEKNQHDRAETSRRWAAVARAPSAHADLGPLPHPALGLGLGVGVRYDSWQALLTGHLSKQQTVNAPEPNASTGAELDRWTADLAVCRAFGSSSVDIGPCLAVALEHATARGFGEGVASQSATTMWPAVGAGALAHFRPVEFMAIFGSLTGYVELSRPRLVIEGLGEVGQLKPVSVGATVGVEWIF